MLDLFVLSGQILGSMETELRTIYSFKDGNFSIFNQLTKSMYVQIFHETYRQKQTRALKIHSLKNILTFLRKDWALLDAYYSRYIVPNKAKETGNDNWQFSRFLVKKKTMNAIKTSHCFKSVFLFFFDNYQAQLKTRLVCLWFESCLLVGFFSVENNFLQQQTEHNRN